MSVPPKRAGYIRLINTIGGILERLDIVKPDLRADKLLAHAQRRTGLQDWGDDEFQTGLARLLDALKTQAQLSQVGRVTAYANLLDHLCVRLRLNHYRAQRPEVATQRIERPLFILGLPRTGTTILHELIAQDPAFRSPASWEVARPVPPPTAQNYDSDGRIAAVQRLLGVMERLSPGFQAIHAVGATLPQECVYILASSFNSEQFGYMYNIPEYRDWALQQDRTSAYAWHARFLQHLQVDNARQRWVLKTPAHLASLKYLLAQYPDASVVWTHRRPLEALSSFSSLACTLRRGFTDAVDPLATGAYEFKHFSAMTHRGMSDRQRLDNGQFIDVSFTAICADPLPVIRTIYERIGMPFTSDVQSRMRHYLQRRPRDLYGEHRFKADEFGLDSIQEQASYGEYLSQFEDYLN